MMPSTKKLLGAGFICMCFIFFPLHHLASGNFADTGGFDTVIEFEEETNHETNGNWETVDTSTWSLFNPFNWLKHLFELRKLYNEVAWEKIDRYTYDPWSGTWRIPPDTSPYTYQVEPPTPLSGTMVEIGIFGGAKLDNFLLSSWFASDPYALRTRILPAASLDIVRENLAWTAGGSSLSLAMGAGYQAHMTSAEPSQDVHYLDVHAIARFEQQIVPSLGMYIGIGPTLVLVPSWDLVGDSIPYSSDPAKSTLLPGICAQGGIRFELDGRTSLGIQGEARLLFTTAFEPFELAGTVRGTLGYRF